MDESHVSGSDDDSVSDEVNESALDNDDLAADELGPTSPMIRTPRKSNHRRVDKSAPNGIYSPELIVKGLRGTFSEEIKCDSTNVGSKRGHT
eukprot:scaffold55760_cov28-Cyclotella_meneghiniana.AAC.2